MIPPNVLQMRLIQTFWAVLRKKIVDKVWTAEETPELISQMKIIIRNVPENLCQKLMRGVNVVNYLQMVFYLK